MKKRLTAIFTLLALVNYAQDTLYYGSNWQNVYPPKEDFHYYAITQPDSFEHGRAKVTFFTKSGKIITEKNYLNYRLDGKVTEWLEYGGIWKETDYKDGKLHGDFRTYWSNGQPKRIDIYKKGNKRSGQCFDSLGKKVKYYDYEIMPEFPGGLNGFSAYLVKRLKYIVERQGDNQIPVIVRFVVDKEGNVGEVKVSAPTSEVTKQIEKVIADMPKWKPGKRDGAYDNFEITQPIRF